MKLKKIVSLALAGILAVSMLTACDSKGGSSSEPTEPVDTSIASVLNEEQDKDNKVKVNFVYDAALEKNVQTALLASGKGASKADVAETLENILDLDAAVDTVPGLYGDKTNNSTPKQGTQTLVFVEKNTDNKTDTQLMKNIADQLGKCATLIAEETVNNIDYSYSYTGKVAMVKAENDNGTVDRYVAVIMTCETTGVLHKD